MLHSGYKKRATYNPYGFLNGYGKKHVPYEKKIVTISEREKERERERERERYGSLSAIAAIATIDFSY